MILIETEIMSRLLNISFFFSGALKISVRVTSVSVLREKLEPSC